MAANWYPVIDEAKCASCNSCVDFCAHGVYGPGPKVVAPHACVEFCRGCSKICPSEAISYYGDN
ncbi:ATP-binding protein [Rectinema subterraneum]|jgi:MinD superfamily P-loop ATPase containing an inserted ferredoxin domain|uniref:ATP-binding protein n=1 Tax=Rectinema subterraneum TaxID=2653714 RepID=UPI00131E2595|nr:4Fe-4S ferredoxin [Rectinema subterraneum]